MKVMISGGTGLLGSALRKINPEIIAPDRHDMDVTREWPNYVLDRIRESNPDCFIHCAGFVGNPKIDEDPASAIRTNIIGTANAVLACMQQNVRFIYISTDYLHGGTQENAPYKETDLYDPVDKYGSWTKLAGECVTRLYLHNSLIIRTTFCPDTFYPEWKFVFTDSYTSKDKISIIAPLIYKLSVSRLTGIINVGTERKTLASLAKDCEKNLDEFKLADKPNTIIPKDTSFDLTKLNDFLKNNGDKVNG